MTFPISGITENEYCRYISLNTGLTTLLNSKHMNLPPVFSTLLASDKAFRVLGTFLSPNEIVYASKVLSGKGSSSAFPQIN